MDDAECSEICFCSNNLALTCHALCVPFKPCRTALAFYSHASPAYQAFRGRCLCYSGNFICMRPQPGEYTLPGELEPSLTPPPPPQRISTVSKRFSLVSSSLNKIRMCVCHRRLCTLFFHFIFVSFFVSCSFFFADFVSTLCRALFWHATHKFACTAFYLSVPFCAWVILAERRQFAIDRWISIQSFGTNIWRRYYTQHAMT